MANKTQVSRDIRVVKKTLTNNHAQVVREWYEVQYVTWVPYRSYNGALKFKDKKDALNYALRKKAGAKSNSTITEVIA